MVNKWLRLGAQGIILLLSFVLVAYGQTISGSISGHVYDAQMAPIQGASVTVTDPSKNFSATTKTGMEGNFLSAGLPPGNYSVSVEAPGFKKLSRTGVPLNASRLREDSCCTALRTCEAGFLMAWLSSSMIYPKVLEAKCCMSLRTIPKLVMITCAFVKVSSSNTLSAP